ncbi:hypothetical protein VVAX_04069 [Variovorax paradoxus]|uniref:Uncharacterized protein n=1 Tax=Variovorax paradoxus TaxID=34073 RepID=A0A679JLK1_VARPD|nr:hypothetical protein VVAX_04069 [Variovorax paradoxus]
MPIVHTKTELSAPRGRLRLDIFNALEEVTGEEEMGNCPSFVLTIDSEKAEEFSAETAGSELIGTLTGKVKRTAKITCNNMSMATYQRFLAATSEVVVQSAVAVTGELRTVTPGKIYQLGQTAANPIGVRNVTAVSVKTEDGTTPYVAGEDFNVDPETGAVQIIAGGGITAGVVQFGYTPVAGSYTRLKTGGNTSFLAAVRVVADNASGSNKDWYMPRVSMTPSGDLPIVSNEVEFVKVEFDVDVLKSANAEAVYVGGRPVA